MQIKMTEFLHPDHDDFKYFKDYKWHLIQLTRK